MRIRETFELSKRRYGAPKIKKKLEHRGIIIGLNRVSRLMREEGMKSIISKKYRALNKVEEVGELNNKLKQDFKSKRYGEKISGDITYIKTKDRGWCYLSSYMDLYNNKILAWNFSPRMNVELVLSTLEKIPKKHLKGSIVHTDRGSQYTSKETREKLREYGAYESYSRKGNPYDNACIESFHATLKKELIYSIEEKSYEEMRGLLFEYIESWYNNERIQKRLGYLSPTEYLRKSS